MYKTINPYLDFARFRCHVVERDVYVVGEESVEVIVLCPEVAGGVGQDELK
jgi:hypothetical protein